MQNRDLRDAIIILQTQYDFLEKQVTDNKITAQDIRDRQFQILTEIRHLKTLADNSNIPSGFVERFMGIMLGANKWYILALAGFILFWVLALFFPDGLVKIIGAFRGTIEP